MINNKNIVFLMLAFLLLQGCASAYKPSVNVMALTSSMTKAEAMNIVKVALGNPNRKSGICGGAGVPGGDNFYKRWEMNKKDAAVSVTEEGFSVNAYRSVPSTTVSGHYVSSLTATTTYKNAQQFRQDIKFSDIEYMRIFREEGLEYSMCYIFDGYSGVMIGLKTGLGNFFTE